jgi:hypothetical protein
MKWSYSMHTTMRRCQRQFAYSHLIAKGTATEPVRHAAFVRKQLQTLPNWRGHLVHETLAADFLADWTAGRGVRAEQLAAAAWRRAERQLAFSAAHRYRDPAVRKSSEPDYCALLAHEDGPDLGTEQLDQLRSDLAACFANLASQTELLTTMARGAKHQSERTMSPSVAGARVTAILDWTFEQAGGAPSVIDWKVVTGTASNYAHQLLLYALAVVQERRWPTTRLGEVDIWEVNLLRNEVARHRVTEERLVEVENFVFEGLRQMRSLTEGGYEALDLTELDIARSPRTCALCSFVPLCMDQLASEGRVRDVAAIQGMLTFA